MLTLLAILAAFWLLTAVQRAGIGPAAASRYIYVSAVFVVALGIELVRDVAMSRRAWLVVAGAMALILVANIATMNTGARFLREQGLLTRTGLTALEITRPVVRPDHPAEGIAGYPFVVVRAGQYFQMERDLGTPAASVEELAGAPENARRAADDELARIHGVALQPAGETSGGAAPTVDRATGGSVSTSGGCVTFTPGTQPGAALELTVPANGVVLTALDGPATVTLRRFADEFPDKPVGRLAAGDSGLLRDPPRPRPEPMARTCRAGGAVDGMRPLTRRRRRSVSARRANGAGVLLGRLLRTAAADRRARRLGARARARRRRAGAAAGRHPRPAGARRPRRADGLERAVDRCGRRWPAARCRTPSGCCSTSASLLLAVGALRDAPRARGPWSRRSRPARRS